MKIITNSYENISISDYFHYLNNIFTSKSDDILFFDIETTGFSSLSNLCYLIGCVSYDSTKQIFNTIQWFADVPSDEADILSAFVHYSSNYKTLIHFNGDNFDIPFINKRCELLSVNNTIQSLKSIDLFKYARSANKFLNFENCKQKTIELNLGVVREDKYNGGELIKFYQDYVKMYLLKEDCSESQQLLLKHNFDDICGLTQILPIISYTGIRNLTSIPTDNLSASLTDSKKLSIQITLEAPVPIPFSLSKNYYSLSVKHNIATIDIDIYEGELKYFYPNYKDYYYLKDEDYAIHKSVAFYVDKNYRVQAKAANCYSKKRGEFLPQPTEIISPFFRKEYKEAMSFFEISNVETAFADKEKILSYARSITQYILE